MVLVGGPPDGTAVVDLGDALPAPPVLELDGLFVVNRYVVEHAPHDAHVSFDANDAPPRASQAASAFERFETSRHVLVPVGCGSHAEHRSKTFNSRQASVEQIFAVVFRLDELSVSQERLSVQHVS